MLSAIRDAAADVLTDQVSCITATVAPVLFAPLHRAPSVGRGRAVGGPRRDSCDNALAESIIGLYKTEVIRQRSPWLTSKRGEFATLKWVDWFNRRRFLERIGYVPPPELKETYYQQCESRPWCPDSNKSVSGKPGAVHNTPLCVGRPARPQPASIRKRPRT